MNLFKTGKAKRGIYLAVIAVSFLTSGHPALALSTGSTTVPGSIDQSSSMPGIVGCACPGGGSSSIDSTIPKGTNNQPGIAGNNPGSASSTTGSIGGPTTTPGGLPLTPDFSSSTGGTSPDPGRTAHGQ